MSYADSILIQRLRFPLAVMVVFIHCGNRLFVKGGEWLRIMLADVIPAIAVPLFYLISGYLFFQGLEAWDWNEWKNKMRRRINTLLIPYLIWTSLYIAYVYLHQCRLSLCAEGGWIPVSQWFSDNGGIRMWWDSIVTENSHPLGYRIISAHPFHRVMWFVRDLMVVNLLSPFIHWALRKGGKWILVGLLLLYLLELWPRFHSIGITCVFFYATGAYLSVNGRDLGKSFSKWKASSWFASFLLLAPMILIRKSDSYILLRPIWCIVWMVAFVNMMAVLPLERDERIITFLSDSSIFVYVTHSVVLSNIRQAFLVLLLVHFSEVTVFLFTAMLTVPFCVSVYYLIRKGFPRVCAFICGR